MGRDVLIVASGETERRSLPHLLRHVIGSEVRSLVGVRMSPHGVLNPPVAERIITAAFWDLHLRGQSVDKVVVLVDADRQAPEKKLEEFAGLPARMAQLPIAVRVAVAKWHLEAWFFADAGGLRAWLGRAPGAPETDADAIQLPKHRLRSLLHPQTYTPRIAESIAASLSPDAIRAASASFAAFEAAVRNGGPVRGSGRPA